MGSNESISPGQRRHYEEQGYLLLESFLDDAWLARLRSAAAEFVEKSREVTASTRLIDVEPGHTAESPRLRRLVSPVDVHPDFHELAISGPIARLACDLLGGAARFHHSKLNYKWADGGEEVEWHQDIQFWPHTDFTPLTIGVYLEDVDDEMGPMGVLPGSHDGPLYDLYDRRGAWTGAMRTEDTESLGLEPPHDAAPAAELVWLRGPAGSVTVHNCCMVHGSRPNRSDRGRPLLLQTYSAVDSYPIAHIGANGVTGRVSGAIIGGPSPQTITVDGRVLHGAPDWSAGGPPTIFGSQRDGR
jgi:ectoine hydroxylase